MMMMMVVVVVVVVVVMVVVVVVVIVVGVSKTLVMSVAYMSMVVLRTSHIVKRNAPKPRNMTREAIAPKSIIRLQFLVTNINN